MMDDIATGPDPDELAAEWAAIMELSDSDGFFEAAQAYWQRMLVRRFGSDIESLSRNDDQLVAWVKSAEPERQRMALSALVQLRYVYHPQLIETCLDYLESGEDAHVKLLCAAYLGRTAAEKADDEIIGAVLECGQRLRHSQRPAAGEIGLRCIDLLLAHLEPPRSPS